AARPGSGAEFVDDGAPGHQRPRQHRVRDGRPRVAVGCWRERRVAGDDVGLAVVEEECALRFAEPSVSQQSSTIPTFACPYTGRCGTRARRIVVARKRSWSPSASVRRYSGASRKHFVPAGIQLIASRSRGVADEERTVSVVDASPGQPPVLVLMGVSGCGKSTVAGLLAGLLGWDFEEGDDLHPAANVDKMASGHQLDDEDRWPWLAKVAQWIGEHTDAGRPGIITCSALKKSYRDVLRGERVVFVYLAGTREQIGRRVAAPHGPYSPAPLLASRFDALGPPTPEENSITVEIGASASVETDAIMSRLGLISKASTQAGK